jgi:hypothetical protein
MKKSEEDLKKLVMLFKMKYKKLLIWWKRKFYPHPKLTEVEVLTKTVLIRLLSSPTTKCFMTPSGFYYIQSWDKNYTMIISNGCVKLSNHKYSFETLISHDVSKELILIIEKHIEKSRLKMENEITENEISLLKEMLENPKL